MGKLSIIVSIVVNLIKAVKIVMFTVLFFAINT